jgi:hypothetical protein
MLYAMSKSQVILVNIETRLPVHCGPKKDVVSERWRSLSARSTSSGFNLHSYRHTPQDSSNSSITQLCRTCAFSSPHFGHSRLIGTVRTSGNRRRFHSATHVVLADVRCWATSDHAAISRLRLCAYERTKATGACVACVPIADAAGRTAMRAIELTIWNVLHSFTLPQKLS